MATAEELAAGGGATAINPVTGIITVAAALKGSSDAKKAERERQLAIEKANLLGISELRRTEEATAQRLQPFEQGGQVSLDALLGLLGLGPAQGQAQAQSDQRAPFDAQLSQLNDNLVQIDQMLVDAEAFVARTPKFARSEAEASVQPLRDQKQALLTRAAGIRDQISALPPIQSQPGQQNALAGQQGQPGQVAGQQALPGLPELPGAIEGPQAIDFADLANNPIMAFLEEEGFRGINEGGAGGGRNTDRDLARFKTGLNATVLPQLQQQQFGQQQQVFANQSNQQQQNFLNQLGLRGTVGNERQQQVGNLLNLVTQGQNAAARTGTNALNTASNTGNLLLNTAQAQGQAAVNNAANKQQLIGNILQTGGSLFPGAAAPPPQQDISSIFGDSTGTTGQNILSGQGGFIQNPFQGVAIS